MSEIWTTTNHTDFYIHLSFQTAAGKNAIKPFRLGKCTFLHKTGTGNRCKCVEVTVFWKMSLMIALLIGLSIANKSCSLLFFSTFPVYDPTEHGDYVILALEENVVFFNFWDAFFMVERLIKKGKIPVVLPQCLMWLFIKNFDLLKAPVGVYYMLICFPWTDPHNMLVFLKIKLSARFFSW